MTSGTDPVPDPALQAALDDFEAAGAETRAMVEATARFRDNPEDRAQAYVGLVEARAMAHTHALAPRLDDLRVHGLTSWNSTVFGLGQNCPDFRYGVLLLDGRRRYRLRGHVGDTRLLLVQTRSHVMGHPDFQELGNCDLTELADGSGRFDVVLGATERIPLDGSSELNSVFVRRILARVTDDPGQLRVEPLDAGPAPPPETDADATAERLHRAADLLRAIVRDWTVGLYELYLKAAGGKNRFGYITGQEMADRVGGSPSATYGMAVWDLAPGEVAIVEWEPPASAYWSFQLADVWSKSLDFVNFQTDLNLVSTALDVDGRARFVLSPTDPGVPNWLDTRGRREGIVLLRNYRTPQDTAAPTVTVLKADDLRDALPAETPQVSVEQRRQALRSRRDDHLAALGE